MVRIVLMAFVSIIFVIGCSSKKKDEGADNLAAVDQGADIVEKPLAFDPLGSDSGTIAGLSTINFGYDSATLSESAKAGLAKNAEWIKGNPGVMVNIEGHCDSKGSNEYNLTLGDRRANAVKAYLQGLGVEANRMQTQSYGEEKLLAMGDSEADHARNRRANFVPVK